MLIVAVGLYVFFVEPLWVVPVLERMTPNILYRGKTNEPLVALSFDDGPNAEFTPQVLELLKQNNAKATFFLIGERAERNPELVRRILEEGNEPGNHWWRDGSVILQSEKGFVEGLERTERAIKVAERGKGGQLQKAGPTKANLPTSETEEPCPSTEFGRVPNGPGAPTEEKTRTLKTDTFATLSVKGLIG
jgi:hypothetical protein